MEEKDSDQISKKSFSESAKLHPSTPDLTQTPSITPIIGLKRPISGKGVKKSKYNCVNWCKSRKQWHAYFRVGGKTIDCGRHMTDEAAALAYDAFARKVMKRILRNLNFPDESDGVAVAKSDQRVADAARDELPDDEDFFGPGTVADYEKDRDSVNVGDGKEG